MSEKIPELVSEDLDQVDSFFLGFCNFDHPSPPAVRSVPGIDGFPILQISRCPTTGTGPGPKRVPPPAHRPVSSESPTPLVLTAAVGSVIHCTRAPRSPPSISVPSCQTFLGTPERRGTSCAPVSRISGLSSPSGEPGGACQVGLRVWPVFSTNGWGVVLDQWKRTNFRR